MALGVANRRLAGGSLRGTLCGVVGVGWYSMVTVVWCGVVWCVLGICAHGGCLVGCYVVAM